MNKKVIKSSNKNEKYNLKSVLDTDNIMSGVSLKAVTAIGCASVVASCGNKDPKESKNEGNKDKVLQIGGKDLNLEQIKEIKDILGKEVSELTEDDIVKFNNYFKDKKIDDIFDKNGKIKASAKDDIKKLLSDDDKTKLRGNQNEDTFIFDKLTNDQKQTLNQYGITDQNTLDEFLNIKDNEGFKDKKISDLFNEKDIKDETLKTKLEAYKHSKQDDEVKEILKSIMPDADITSFLNYVKYINDKLENIQNSIFNDIKANKGKEKELKDKIKKFCEKYVKSDNKINYDDISKIKNIILINSIKEDIKAKLEDGQDVSKLKFTYSKGNDCIKLKITHSDDKTNTKFAEIEIQFESEELLKLKEKEDKEIQLYRIKDGNDGIKYNIDDTKETEIKNLFPKTKNDEAIKAITESIKTEFAKTFKDGANGIQIQKLADIAKVLKNFITINQKLNTGKVNENNTDKWIYDNVNSIDDLDGLFGKKGDYVVAVKAEFDAIIKKINDDLGKVTSGELVSNAMQKQEYKMTENIEGATIKDTINGHFTEDAAELIAYVPNINAQKAKIAFDDNYNVTDIQLPSGFELVTDNVLEYGSNNNDSKTNALTELKAELKKVLENICKNNFGKNKVENGKNVLNKDEINKYITTELTYDKVKSFNDTQINGLEATLKDKCGVNLKTLSTKNDIKDNIVEPLLAKVFGDKDQCKAVFTKMGVLSSVSVKDGDATQKLGTAGADNSLAQIRDNTNTAINRMTANVNFPDLVFKHIKNAIQDVSNAVNKVINESDSSKKASDAFIKALKTIIGEPGKDNGVADSEHLSLAFNNKASLLFKWLYVDGTKWNDPDANGKKHHDAAIASFVNVLACFLNKNASYKGVADGTNTISTNNIAWNNVGGGDGANSKLLHANGIATQLTNPNYALMIEKAKQVKIYFSNTLVPNTYANITVSDLKVGGGPQTAFAANDILIDDSVAPDKRPMMYYIFQLVGGHDKYKHTILAKEQTLSGALTDV